MATLRDILQRFRPTGAPGAAASAGVPADRRARAEAELQPVFAALTATVDTCVEIRRIGTALALAHTTAAAHRAAAVVAGATRVGPDERCAAAERARADLASELAAIRAGAVRDAERVRRRADAVTSGLVDRAVGHVRADILALDLSRRPTGGR
jgi:hypothetical protein